MPVDPLPSKEAPLNRYVLFCTIVACLAAFNNGYNLGVPNVPESVIRNCTSFPDDVSQLAGGGTLPSCLPMNDLVWGFTVGAFALGGLVGGAVASLVTPLLGRRNTLLYNNAFFVCGGLLMAFATTVAQLIIGRLFVGAASGLSSVIIGIYVAEIAPVRSRGALGGAFELVVVFGMLVAQCLGLGLSFSPGWRYLLGITIFPAVLQSLLLPFCAESPRHLIQRHDLRHAKLALQSLRHGCDISDELAEMVSAQQSSLISETFTAYKPLTIPSLLLHPPTRALRRATLIAVALHALNQLTGINGTNFYSTRIFEGVFNGDMGKAARVTTGIGALNVIACACAVALVDRVGRRALLLGSLGGMATFAAVIVVGLKERIDGMVAAAAMLFSAASCLGIQTVPWVIIPELLPTHAVSAVTALSIAMNWLCGFLVAFLFPLLQSALGDWTFVVFAVVSTIGVVFAWVCVPETRGRSIEENSGEMIKESGEGEGDEEKRERE